MSTSPLVSLCMMVKNEATTLRQCLDSIASVADEIIIVDTGSTDGTQEIIREYQEAEYFFEWNDDFAAARNYVASLATGEYVCRWDADWVLREGDLEKILVAKASGFEGAHEVHFNWINEFHPDSLAPISSVTHMFLYRRELFEWYCAVPAHDMTRSLDPNLVITQAVYPDIWVYHLKDPVEKAHRYDQTHELIRTNLERLPQSHPDRVINLQFYLSSCLFRHEHAEALTTLREMLSKVEPANELYTWLLESEVTCLLHLNRPREAYTRAFASYQHRRDYRTTLALADVVALLEPASAPGLYREYLDLDKRGDHLDLNYERYRVHPVFMLGHLTQDRSLLEQAKRMTRRPDTLRKISAILGAA